MHTIGKLFCFTFIDSATLWHLLLLVALLPIGVGYSSTPHHQQPTNNILHGPKVSAHQMAVDITIHGLLLWLSMGFLMPLGILAIRMSSKVECGGALKLLFYAHFISQTLGVVVATVGAVMSIRKFENSFDNNHKRMGLALHVAIYVQLLLGFCRPNRGSKGRSVWYFLHWMLGTSLSVLGVINTYTGLGGYHKKTSKSISLWTALFSAEVCVLAFLYLLQDRWNYIQKQRVVLSNGSLPPSNYTHHSSPESIIQTQLPEPNKKRNALGNYFKI